jgi:hypothetical protein
MAIYGNFSPNSVNKWLDIVISFLTLLTNLEFDTIPTFCTSLPQPLFIDYGNWLDSGEMTLSGLIGRHVALSMIGFYGIGKACWCTSRDGFACGPQGCWNGHKCHWLIIYSLEFPNKVLTDLLHRLLCTQSLDSRIIANTLLQLMFCLFTLVNFILYKCIFSLILLESNNLIYWIQTFISVGMKFCIDLNYVVYFNIPYSTRTRCKVWLIQIWRRDCLTKTDVRLT